MPSKGCLSDRAVLYQGMPVTEWLAERGLKPEDIEENHDLQAARLFPLCGNVEDLGLAMRWMTTEPELEDGRKGMVLGPQNVGR